MRATLNESKDRRGGWQHWPEIDATAAGLVDVEMTGYKTHVQEAEEEQHHGDQAHDGQRYE